MTIFFTYPKEMWNDLAGKRAEQTVEARFPEAKVVHHSQNCRATEHELFDLICDADGFCIMPYMFGEMDTQMRWMDRVASRLSKTIYLYHRDGQTIVEASEVV